ncbi:MAG: hypothetical protein ACJ74W_22055 [Pyrinomonadaceae bacterium]
MRTRLFSLCVCAAAVGLSLGLGGCTRVVPPTAQFCQPLKEPTPFQPVSATDAVIVTDVSGSMKGFALSGSVQLFTLHEEIERAVRGAVNAAGSAAAIKRCYLGSDLDCRTQINLRELDKDGTYNAKESRLDLFMRPAAQSGNTPAAAKGAEDPIAPYRIAVLVSDGMQARTTGASESAPCMAGADPDCMAHLLKQRAQQGYGIWLALLLLPFKGTHYPERPLDEAIWQRIEQHVAGLGQDPLYQGVTFKASRAGAGAPFESYHFEGVKPILVLALSKDIEAGRKFIQQFGDAIRRDSVVQPANAVYTMELAPLAVVPRQIAKLSIPPTAPAQGARQITSKRQPGLYDYLIECERNCATTLKATTEERGGQQVLPAGVRVDFELVPADGSLPSKNLRIAAAPDQTFDLGLNGQQLGEGSYETCLSLRANLKPDPQSDTFWRALHTDNMYEAPERLYGLREMVQQVLDMITQQPRVTDQVRFRVERK